ncbi:uncharacterized protein E0L32_011478 [Thyridium curvatum]|uniref:DUF7918 domain-containing protein n=1 Tax=Thyridium curvatum TaxID=1093900 RepID=A0A507BH85_9PEZI|nr:uncharacterized protein E0L32_011478 [Thyridium curvatum]TPX18863.1 hypothetical protein E0L32_011478 [Thyridium curvatum]
MPCFKGIAVSIHANGAPLPEYGMQKQSRVSRINSYIPVPPPQIDSGKPEPAKFAISITLLTSGLAIPYSTPKATEANPYPKPQLVGTLPPSTAERGMSGVVTPYIPMTNSEHETIAAYIYFDGRAKEEVATLLRPGEETWVNSRWVQVPISEGGGLAEREFLFREVGLERWLNGLDLEGHDAAEKVEKRRQKFERRRRRQEAMQGGGDLDMDSKAKASRDTFRYGSADSQSPVEAVSDDFSDSMDSDDEPPEATGQIKVAMFRVLASGEIKKGEYSPQFDAHDDDDDYEGGNKADTGNSIDADVEHTTSFAKPKTLDPKTISTQTVTGIDGPEKPYATFTFFYRGERQLQKMGVLPSSKGQQATPTSNKRRSAQLDFSNLGPLKTGGTVGFSTFRDNANDSGRRRKQRKSVGGMDEDSESDDDSDQILGRMEDVDDKVVKSKVDPEDAKVTGELAEGVDRVRVGLSALSCDVDDDDELTPRKKLKRQHSADPDGSLAASGMPRKSPSAGPFGGSETPPETKGGQPIPGASSSSSGAAAAGGMATGTAGMFGKSFDDAIVGSPLKKHRASIHGIGDESEEAPRPASFPPALGDVLAKAEAAQQQKQQQQTKQAAAVNEEEEEEI